MPEVRVCPDAEELRRLMLGEISDPEAERLEQHLSQCERCDQLVDTVKAEDTLTSAMRAQTIQADTETEIIDGLIKRLQGLRSGSSLAPLETRPLTGAATPGDADAPSAEATQEVYNFLASPRGTGEVGSLDQYRILKILGAGGMGVVFLAEDTQLKRKVALKAMKPSRATNLSLRQRFLREAQMVASLTHDHIVTIHQVGEHRDVPFLVMPLLQGETLEARLQRESRLSVADILRIGREIAEGLAAAHEQGLIHRDIKPGNLWLEGPSARVKILDFGLAREVEANEQITTSGMILGTPGYMAPEQIRNESIDGRSDLFSLGCVLYRLCTTAMPFAGKDIFSVLLAVTHEQPKPPVELNPVVPPSLSVLVMQLLAKDPAQRPPSARALVQALAVIETEPAPLQATPTPAGKPLHRRLLLLATALLLLGCGIFYLQQIIIRITDEKGNVTEHKVPPGGKLEVIRPPLPPLPTGRALSPLALIQRPARIDGVQSWTIETVAHRGQIRGLAYRSDGRRLASAGDDGAIRIWDVAAGKLVAVLISPDHQHAAFMADLWYNPRMALAWSPDGKLLAAASTTHEKLRLWDPESGKVERVLSAESPVYALTWDARGKVLASAHDDKIVLWEATSGQQMGKLDHKPAPHTLAFAPDGNTLATVALDSVRVFSLEEKRLLKTRPHQQPEHSPFAGLAWSPDSKNLAIGVPHPTPLDVVILDVPALTEIRRLEGSGTTLAMLWSAQGNQLTTLGGGKLFIWDGGSGKRLGGYSLEASPINKILPATMASFTAISPSGDTVACGLSRAVGGEVAIWRGQEKGGKLLHAWTGNGVLDLSGTPDGSRLATVSGDGMLRLWEMSSPEPFRVLANDVQSPPVCCEMNWSPDGKKLALSNPGDTTIWQVDTGKRLGTIPEGAQGFLSWSDHAVFALREQNRKVGFWESARFLRVLEIPREHAEGRIALSPNGQMLATNAGNKVRVYQAAPPTPGPSLLCALESPALLQGRPWSPGGTSLACGSPFAIKVWEVPSGKLLKTLPYDSHLLASTVAWSADGKNLACRFNHDGTVVLWKGDSTKPAHTYRFTSVPWSRGLSCPPDGKTLLTPGDSTIYALNTENGERRGALVILWRSQGIALSDDGHYHATPQTERELVYVVQTDKGQQTLTPADFAQSYHWKNDPERVRLTAE